MYQRFYRTFFSIRNTFAGLVLILAGSLSQAIASTHVDNFVLIDHAGAAHELYYHKDAKAVVLITHGNGCQILRNNLPDYRALRDDYADKGIQIMMINANLQDNRSSIAAEAAEWEMDFPILDDTSQIISKALEINRTGEVLVINPKNWQIVYRGPMNDRVDYERQKKKAEKLYVRDTLDALIAGQEVAFNKINAPGCIVNYEKADGAAISYSETIAPLLKENCTACHVPGGIAPWAMTEYNMIKGFAPMIREVVRTKRMPPWHADPEIGHWSNDVGLSDEEVRTLISWIEAGAPRGEGPDLLKEQVKPLENKWGLGEPDLVIDIPPFEVPASGIVEYQFPNVANPLDRDVWVIGAAVIPGDPKAVHHILAGSSDKPNTEQKLDEVFENFILTYAPGNESSYMPKGTGVFVPKGGVFQFQMHYTPYGKKSVDRSKLGLYLSDTPPENFYREHVIANPALVIPANTEAHEEKAYFIFDKDAEIHALFPHSHYRGVSSVFELDYPDGKKETILSVPNYDFNWQRTYQFKEPKAVPAGTRILHRTIYNNSARNRGNPDPDSPVYWGLQSEEEMLYGSIGYSWADETTAKPIHNRELHELQQMLGFMDQDLNGKIAKDEMRGSFREKFSESFPEHDLDNDGGLSLEELVSLFKKLSAQKSADQKS